MDTVRLYLALFMVVMVPPAVAFWLVAHPLVSLWRWLGPAVAYSILLAMTLLVGWVCFRNRGVLIGEDLGAHPVPIISGLLLYCTSITLELQIRKQLKLTTFTGLAELDPDRVEGKLLHEGVYGHVRHPKYVSGFLGILGFALFTNYSGALIIVAMTLPGFYGIVLLEERELLDRFGEEYRRYKVEVPRFLPRLFS